MKNAVVTAIAFLALIPTVLRPEAIAQTQRRALSSGLIESAAETDCQLWGDLFRERGQEKFQESLNSLFQAQIGNLITGGVFNGRPGAFNADLDLYLVSLKECDRIPQQNLQTAIDSADWRLFRHCASLSMNRDPGERLRCMYGE